LAWEDLTRGEFYARVLIKIVKEEAMPKILDYPRSSLKRSLALAEAVDKLGGSCTSEMCAHQMEQTVSGAFKATMSAAIKHNLVSKHKDKLSVTETYREYKLAYSDAERLRVMQQAFLSAPLFRRIYDRFRGKLLPVDIFDKLLAKEFGLDMNAAQKTSRFFIQGAKLAELLSSDNSVVDIEDSDGSEMGESGSAADKRESGDSTLDKRPSPSRQVTDPSTYSIHVQGPGVESTISITEEEDFDILDALLRKIRRSVGEKSKEEPQ
jgi:hypothetical protein